MDNDRPVKCCRCRHEHMQSERISVQDKKHSNWSHLVCPRCRAKTVFNMSPTVAWCFASGKIELGNSDDMPDGAILIARGVNYRLSAVISTLARHAYNSLDLLVPGVPEASDQREALAALTKWLAWCRAKKHPGVEFANGEA